MNQLIKKLNAFKFFSYNNDYYTNLMKSIVIDCMKRKNIKYLVLPKNYFKLLDIQNYCYNIPHSKREILFNPNHVYINIEHKNVKFLKQTSVEFLKNCFNEIYTQKKKLFIDQHSIVKHNKYLLRVNSSVVAKKR